MSRKRILTEAEPDRIAENFTGDLSDDEDDSEIESDDRDELEASESSDETSSDDMNDKNSDHDDNVENEATENVTTNDLSLIQLRILKMGRVPDSISESSSSSDRSPVKFSAMRSSSASVNIRFRDIFTYS